jgi:hypothetical protein
MALALAASACVPKTKYDAALKDAPQARTDALGAHGDAAQCKADPAKARAQLNEMDASLHDMRTHAAERDKALGDAQGASHESRSPSSPTSMSWSPSPPRDSAGHPPTDESLSCDRDARLQRDVRRVLRTR